MQITGEGVQVWVADALDNVLRSAVQPAQPAQEITLEAAQGEYESGQIVVRSSAPLAGLRASAGPLKGPGEGQIPAQALRCRFVGYVSVERNTPATPPEELVAQAPEMFPDPLLEEGTLDVPADTAQPIWVTVHVPPDAPSGEYVGAVRLSWDGGEAAVPVRLTVWPFAIPVERHLYYTNWISVGALCRRYKVEAYSEAFWTIFERYAANVGAHRQNILWVSPSTIRCFREEDGTLSFDFTIFDRWVETCERHGVADLIEIAQLGAFKTDWGGPEIVLHGVRVTQRGSGQTETRPAEEILPALLAALQEHLRQRGWLQKTVLHIADEPSVNNVRSWCEKSDWVHSLAPELRRIDAIEAPDFGKSLEVWVPKLSHFHNWQASYEAARARGAELWFYTCCHPMGRYPNRFVDYPLIKTRILQWLNWRYRLKGYLHWGLQFWTEDPLGSAISGGLPPGDAWIIYPGPEGPLDSIRWETVRDGFEDYELLWVLTDCAAQVKARLGEAAADFDPALLADELCREAAPTILDYTRQPATLRDIRHRVAQQIIALQSAPDLLVWTDPPSYHALAAGPAVAVLYIAGTPGMQVKVGAKAIELDASGRHAQNLFLHPGTHTIEVTATYEGAAKTVRRVVRVTE